MRKSDEPQVAVDASEERKRRAEERLVAASKIRWTPRELSERMAAQVVGQQDALRTISVAAIQHVAARVRRIASTMPPVQPTRIDPILCIGGPGTGKMLTCKVLGLQLGIPYHIADAGRITAEGWQGLGLSEVLHPLLTQAAGYMDYARCGAVCLDEIDKLRRADMTSHGGRDISGGDAQNVLLKLLNGDVVQFEVFGGPNGTGRTMITFPTDHLLVMAAGAFEGLESVVLDRLRGRRRMGFGGDDRRPDELSPSELRRMVTREDLQTYGLRREICSRFGRIVVFDDLDRRALRRILLETPEGPFSTVQALARSQGFRFDDFPPALIEAILDRCGGDARRLAGLVSQATEAAFYCVPDRIRAMGRRATDGEVVVGLRSDSLDNGYHTVRVEQPVGVDDDEDVALPQPRRARTARGG
ncbi:MAG: AAA family ATPase [Armatimonadia bacterium]